MAMYVLVLDSHLIRRGIGSNGKLSQREHFMLIQDVVEDQLFILFL